MRRADWRSAVTEAGCIRRPTRFLRSCFSLVRASRPRPERTLGFTRLSYLRQELHCMKRADAFQRPIQREQARVLSGLEDSVEVIQALTLSRHAHLATTD